VAASTQLNADTSANGTNIEIDVIGTAAIPEPSAVFRGGLSLLALVLRRRR